MLRSCLSRSVIVVIAWLGAVASTAAQLREQVSAESRETFCGVVVEKTFPGPPNYESISRGDKAETYRFLRIVLPCQDDPAANAELVQLHFKQSVQSRIERSVRGCTLRIVGTLFSAESGHHHTPLVLAVEDVELAGHCEVQPPQDRERRLTPRSSGAPTAGRHARAGGTPYIFTGPGLASCR